MLKDVIDEAADECDIRARTCVNVVIACRRGTRETRIDMDGDRAFALRFHRPMERHGMSLSHVRSHDQDAVAIDKVAWGIGAGTESEGWRKRCNGGGMAIPCGVLGGQDAQTSREELSDEVAFFIIESRSADESDVRRRVYREAVLVLFDEPFVAGLPDTISYGIEHPIDALLLPFARTWCAVERARLSIGVTVQHERRHALGALTPRIDGGARIAFNFDELFVLIEGQLRTAYCAELAYGSAALRFAQPRALMNRTIAQNVIHVSHGQILSFLKRWPA